MGVQDDDVTRLVIETRNVGGVDFIAKSPEEAALYICGLAKSDPVEGFHVHLANAYTVALADKDPVFRNALKSPAINFPDGKPIAIVSKLSRHTPSLRQVRGPDLFENVVDYGRVMGVKHFLLGSTEEVLSLLTFALETRYPGVEIVGSESPPFRSLSRDEVRMQDERIRDSGADVVWVGLGTPKQDFEVTRIAQEMPIVAVAVGAAFDFSAGTLVVAPKWIQRFGLEWMHRLAAEPRRLWRRYLFGNARFISSVIRHSIRRTS